MYLGHDLPRTAKTIVKLVMASSCFIVSYLVVLCLHQNNVRKTIGSQFKNGRVYPVHALTSLQEVILQQTSRSG